jgi:hypothetical protein
MENGETEIFGAGKDSFEMGGSEYQRALFELLPTKPLTKSPIVQVSCSYFDTTFLTSDNELFSVGQICGQQFKKLTAPKDKNIAQIVSIFFNIMVLTSDGELYEYIPGESNPIFIIGGVSQVVPGGYHYAYKGTCFCASNL